MHNISQHITMTISGHNRLSKKLSADKIIPRRFKIITEEVKSLVWNRNPTCKHFATVVQQHAKLQHNVVHKISRDWKWRGGGGLFQWTGAIFCQSIWLQLSHFVKVFSELLTKYCFDRNFPGPSWSAGWLFTFLEPLSTEYWNDKFRLKLDNGRQTTSPTTVKSWVKGNLWTQFF